MSPSTALFLTRHLLREAFPGQPAQNLNNSGLLYEHYTPPFPALHFSPQCFLPSNFLLFLSSFAQVKCKLRKVSQGGGGVVYFVLSHISSTQNSTCTQQVLSEHLLID